MNSEIAPNASNAPLSLLILILAIMAWFGLRAFVRRLRAGRAEAAVHGSFNDYAREALINAAKVDGRVDARERAAIATALQEIGVALNEGALDAAFESARLSKDELIAYLRAKSGAFSREQKVWLLKVLMSVFVSDGHFDEVEHVTLVDYTAAIGFDRQSAPDMLRGIAKQFARGNIT
jgi:uncharacterized membrane protein YebE (DUF533 family)